jgi:thioredoxin reductase
LVPVLCYTAAVYGWRGATWKAPVLITGLQGGQPPRTTTEVDNWPGDEGLQGPGFIEHAETR